MKPALGCCSSISPCAHQRADPTSICEVCSAATTTDTGSVLAKAGNCAAKKDDLSARRLAVHASYKLPPDTLDDCLVRRQGVIYDAVMADRASRPDTLDGGETEGDACDEPYWVGYREGYNEAYALYGKATPPVQSEADLRAEIERLKVENSDLSKRLAEFYHQSGVHTAEMASVSRRLSRQLERLDQCRARAALTKGADHGRL